MTVAMKLVGGTYLPESEAHMCEWMEKQQQWRGGRLCYQAHKLDMALRHVPSERRRICVDAGAHVGTWSMLLQWQFKHIVAFEPSERGEIYPHNMRAENYTLHRVALGDHMGTVALQEIPLSTGGCHVIAGAVGEVPITTLDSFELQEVDFIKVDVEGQEVPFVRGARETIVRNRPIVLIEQKGWSAKHVRDGNKDALKMLLAMGMKQLADRSGDYVLGWK